MYKNAHMSKLNQNRSTSLEWWTNDTHSQNQRISKKRFSKTLSTDVLTYYIKKTEVGFFLYTTC